MSPNFYSSLNSSTIFLSTLQDPILWHTHFGHPLFLVLHTVLESCNLKVKTIPLFQFVVFVKWRKAFSYLLFPLILSLQDLFQIVYLDVWGPSPVLSINGACYFLLFIDDYSKYTWLYLMKNKSGVPQLFHHFHSLFQSQFHLCIQNLQTNGGTEFRALDPFLLANGI